MASLWRRYDVHEHNLRQSKTNFSLAQCDSPTGTFCRAAVSEWNLLPLELKGLKSIDSFRTRLKCFLQTA